MLNDIKFYAYGFCQVPLNGQKSELIFRYIEDLQKGRPPVPTMLCLIIQNCICKCFFSRRSIYVFAIKLKELKEIDPQGRGKFTEIRCRPLWLQVLCLRHIGFDRVSAGCRTRDRVGAKDDRRLDIFQIFFHRNGFIFFIRLDIFSHFSPDDADSPFQTYRTDGHTDRKVN